MDKMIQLSDHTIMLQSGSGVPHMTYRLGTHLSTVGDTTHFGEFIEKNLKFQELQNGDNECYLSLC